MHSEQDPVLLFKLWIPSFSRETFGFSHFHSPGKLHDRQPEMKENGLRRPIWFSLHANKFRQSRKYLRERILSSCRRNSQSRSATEAPIRRSSPRREGFMVRNVPGCEQQQGCGVTDGYGDSASSCRTLETTGSAVGSGGSGGGGGGGGGGSGSGSVQTQPTGQSQTSTHVTPTPTPIAQQSQQPQQPQRPSSLSACYASCCAESAKKVDKTSPNSALTENSKSRHVRVTTRVTDRSFGFFFR